SVSFYFYYMNCFNCKIDSFLVFSGDHNYSILTYCYPCRTCLFNYLDHGASFSYESWNPSWRNFYQFTCRYLSQVLILNSKDWIPRSIKNGNSCNNNIPL